MFKTSAFKDRAKCKINLGIVYDFIVIAGGTHFKKVFYKDIFPFGFVRSLRTAKILMIQ